MRILFWSAQERVLLSFHFLAKARQVQSIVYSKETGMNTYKKFRRFFLHLLHLSTPRPAEKTAGVVVGVHSQVVGRLHCPLRIDIVTMITINHPRKQGDVQPRRLHDIVIRWKGQVFTSSCFVYALISALRKPGRAAIMVEY